MKLTNKNSKTSPADKKTLVIYSRISAAKIHNEDASIEAQINLGKKYAEIHGFEVIGVFSEIVSGKTTKNRSEFNAAVAMATENKSNLWVYSLSRFARSTMDVLKHVEIFTKKGVSLVSHSENLSLDNASSLLQISILSSFCEYERNLASERTKTALTALRESGKRYSGRIPYGYDLLDSKTKKLSKNVFEMKNILEMKRLREEGFSYQKIADIFNGKNIPAKTGGAWIWQSIRGVLNRQSVLGCETSIAA